MKKAVITISTLLFSFMLIFPGLSLAHEGEHSQSSDHGQGSMEHQKFEEGSGSSMIESSSEKKEYAEDKDEGSFSYKGHREEMKHKKSNGGRYGKTRIHRFIQKMEEGSGKR